MRPWRPDAPLTARLALLETQRDALTGGWDSPCAARPPHAVPSLSGGAARPTHHGYPPLGKEAESGGALRLGRPC